MCRASALAYSRLNDLLGALVRDTPSGTAAPSPRTTTGCETICTVRLWCCSVVDLPDSSSLVNSNFFVGGPRIGSGSDSVTRIRRDEHRQIAFLAVGQAAGGADGLVGEEAAARRAPSAARRSCAIPSAGCRRPARPWCCPASASTGLRGAGVGERQPHRAGLPRGRLVGDLDGELDARRPRAGTAAGSAATIRSLAVTALSVQEAAAQFAVVGEAQELPLGQRLGHGELHPHHAVLRRRAGAGRRRPSRSGSCGRRPC